MNNPKVSIVIGVYNVASFLEECLDSILSQQFSKFECLCVNDGSTDNSLEILEKYANKDARIHIITQPNLGGNAARERGFTSAQGAYLYFMDADDMLVPHALKRMVQALENHRADMVIAGFREELEGKVLYQRRICDIESELEKKSLYLDHQHALWNKLFRKKLFEEVKFTDLSIGQDLSIFYQVLLMSGKIVGIPDEVYMHRLHEKTITSVRSPQTICGIIDSCCSVEAYYLSHVNGREYLQLLEGVIIWHGIEQLKKLLEMKSVKDKEYMQKNLGVYLSGKVDSMTRSQRLTYDYLMGVKHTDSLEYYLKTALLKAQRLFERGLRPLRKRD